MARHASRLLWEKQHDSDIFGAKDLCEDQHPVSRSYNRRRDHTTKELFGEASQDSAYSNVRGEDTLPDFVPKDDPRNSLKKKIDFLGASSVMNHATGGPLVHVGGPEEINQQPSKNSFQHDNSKRFSPDANPALRKHQDMCSHVLGHEDRHTDHSPRRQRDPHHSNMAWDATPHQPASIPHDSFSAQDLAYKHKSSDLFGRPSPDAPTKSPEAEASDEKEKEAHAEANEKRKKSQLYSNMFGREFEAVHDDHRESASRERRSVVRADPEHRIASNDQWTNVAADLRGYDDMSTVDRRHRELHTTSVGGIVGSGGGGRPQSRATDTGFRNEFHMCDNNSHKIKMQGDESAREMFHKHMSSTVLGSKGQPITEIHEQDMSWGTADLFIGKLPVTCDDFELKKICHRAAPGFQLVRVKADIDPVTGCCKTTGQITVRYSNNQMLDDLIMGLQDANLHVEI